MTLQSYVVPVEIYCSIVRKARVQVQASSAEEAELLALDEDNHTNKDVGRVTYEQEDDLSIDGGATEGEL